MAENDWSVPIHFKYIYHNPLNVSRWGKESTKRTMPTILGCDIPSYFDSLLITICMVFLISAQIIDCVTHQNRFSDKIGQVHITCITCITSDPSLLYFDKFKYNVQSHPANCNQLSYIGNKRCGNKSLFKRSQSPYQQDSYVHIW